MAVDPRFHNLWIATSPLSSGTDAIRCLILLFPLQRCPSLPSPPSTSPFVLCSSPCSSARGSSCSPAAASS
eukprot:11790010-Ditylum_brightwellii.AAC.1